MTHIPDALKQEETSNALLHRKETCELLRGWLIASYHVMDREVFPRLEALKSSFEHADHHEEVELLENVFGSIASFDELTLKLKALMDCHYSLLIPRRHHDS